MNKVVLLAPTPPPASGIASWTMRILQCGLGNNWEPIVVDEKAIGNRGVFKGARRNLFDEYKRTKKIWSGLKKVLKDPDVKIVQSCIAPSTLGMIREYVCMKMAKHASKKYIVHYRSTLPNYVTNGINRFVFERLSKAADMVFVLNGPSAQMIEKVVGDKYKLIPNFIENNAIKKEPRQINEHLKTATYVGGVTPEKGCDVIIKTARKCPDITFRLVGEISDAIAGEKVPSNVILTGSKNHDAVVKELEMADVFLFLSRFKGEGFSNALVEAMASGLPCIVTDWAANADMVLNQKCGIVVQESSSEVLMDSLNKMAKASVRKSMSHNCIERAQNEYSQDCVIKQYVCAYEELIKR